MRILISDLGWPGRLALLLAFSLWPAPGPLAAQDLHPSDYPKADIEYGARLYAAQCSTCHQPTGDGIAGVNLRSGKFRNNVARDQDLARIITTGIPQTAMPPFKFDAGEVAGIIAYLRNMNTFDPASAGKPGDAQRGQGIFDGKGRCASCHRVNGKGPRSAPDLSDVGALRSAGSLQRSLLDPSSQMMPINRPVRAVTKDGTVINGRRLNEDTYSVQLIDGQERLLSLTKADLKEYTILKTSPMPSFRDTLSVDELADVVAYLLSLKGL
jgi:putative heme-binding domain-containing protein